MDSSPFLSFFIAFLVVLLIENIIGLIKFTINRPMRHINILKHGWPPSHCDADGDFRRDDGDGGNN